MIIVIIVIITTNIINQPADKHHELHKHQHIRKQCNYTQHDTTSDSSTTKLNTTQHDNTNY